MNETDRFSSTFYVSQHTKNWGHEQMSRLNAHIRPYTYITGRNFVNALKDAAGVQKDAQLSDLFGIPRNTISTWSTREICNHEILTRAAIFFNLDLKAFALDGTIKKTDDDKNGIHEFTVRKIINGKDSGKTSAMFDTSLFENDMSKCEIFKTENGYSFVDLSDKDVVDGDFFVDLDGIIQSIKLQRLPAQQVQLVFGGTSAIVNASAINVIGRVISRMETV